MISLSRLVLSAVFLVGIWIDPTQPSRLIGEAYVVLIGYFLASAVYFAVTWDDWRLEARFAGAAHGVDIALFGVMVFLTEGYTSPFFPFSVFILLSAAMKRGRRGTAVTAAIVTALFFAAGLLALELGYGGFATRQFIFRGSYLVVLSLVIVWFGVHLRAERRAAPLDLDPGIGGPAPPPMEAVLEHALAQTRARRGVFVWWEKEEPWIQVTGGGGFAERHPPGTFGDIVDARLAGGPFLFDPWARRALGGGGRRSILSGLDPVDPGFAERFALGSGLAVPVESDAYSGYIFALDLPGMCADDLDVGERLSAELTTALRRRSLIRLTEESAADRTRLALARDLHDGIAQLLAGTSMRLEAVKRLAGDADAVEREIDSLQRELQAEQKGLRTLIGRLRAEPPQLPALPAAGFADLAARLSRQWGIACRAATDPRVDFLPSAIEHELHHLVREGVANAVRHGRASEVAVALGPVQAGLSLTIEDNGTGFAGCGKDPAAPRSLSERAAHLGGRLDLVSEPSGSRLTFILPLETPT